MAVRLLADRSGLTKELSKATARRSFAPIHDRGQVLVDVARSPNHPRRSPEGDLIDRKG